jgi:hypothetical protein
VKKRLKKKINSSGVYPCNICKNESILVTHHINGKNIQNANKEWNLAAICDNCHRGTHEGQIIIEGWFYTTKGMELFWHYAGEPSKTGSEEATPYIIPRKP